MHQAFTPCTFLPSQWNLSGTCGRTPGRDSWPGHALESSEALTQHIPQTWRMRIFGCGVQHMYSGRGLPAGASAYPPPHRVPVGVLTARAVLSLQQQLTVRTWGIGQRLRLHPWCSGELGGHLLLKVNTPELWRPPDWGACSKVYLIFFSTSLYILAWIKISLLVKVKLNGRLIFIFQVSNRYSSLVF